MTDTVTMTDLLERADRGDVTGLSLGRLWPADSPAAPAIVVIGVWMWATALGASRETPGWLVKIRQHGLPQGSSDVLCQAMVTATIDEHLGVNGAAIRGYLAGGGEVLPQAERGALLGVMATLMERVRK